MEGLECVYAVVFMDAIHYHVRSEGRIVKKAVYIAIGNDLDGHKDVLGLRNSGRYVSYKDSKALVADLRAVYAAPDAQAALSALDNFEEIWGQKYPRIAAS